MQQTAEFNVKMYLGNQYSEIEPNLGIVNDTFIANYSQTLLNNANWTSQLISYNFTQPGLQFIGLELYQNSPAGWQYCENYTLYLRVNVTLS